MYITYNSPLHLYLHVGIYFFLYLAKFSNLTKLQKVWKKWNEYVIPLFQHSMYASTIFHLHVYLHFLCSLFSTFFSTCCKNRTKFAIAFLAHFIMHSIYAIIIFHSFSTMAPFLGLYPFYCSRYCFQFGSRVISMAFLYFYILFSSPCFIFLYSLYFPHYVYLLKVLHPSYSPNILSCQRSEMTMSFR
jgi:hypothetical protein